MNKSPKIKQMHLILCSNPFSMLYISSNRIYSSLGSPFNKRRIITSVKYENGLIRYMKSKNKLFRSRMFANNPELKYRPPQKKFTDMTASMSFLHTVEKNIPIVVPTIKLHSIDTPNQS